MTFKYFVLIAKIVYLGVILKLTIALITLMQFITMHEDKTGSKISLLTSAEYIHKHQKNE